MKNKKILACLCCAAMLFSATACAGTTTETTTTEETTATTVTTEESTTAASTEETSETTTEASETTAETSEDDEDDEDEDNVCDDDEINPAYEKVATLPEKDADKGFDKLENGDDITGTIYGINKTGDTIYAMFEKKVRLSEEQVKALKVGDSIGYKDTEVDGAPDLKVAKIEKDGKHLMIELKTSDDPEDYCEWGIFWYENADCYLITGSSDIAYTEEIGYYAVPIASDCKIKDGYEPFTEEDVQKEYKKAEKTGIPVFDTLYWFSSTTSEYRAEDLYTLGDNGWYCTDTFFDATIKDGKIVKLLFWTT